jgi:hypothetical protein
VLLPVRISTLPPTMTATMKIYKKGRKKRTPRRPNKGRRKRGGSSKGKSTEAAI